MNESDVERRRAWVEAWWARPDSRAIPFTEKVCELVEACVEDAVAQDLARFRAALEMIAAGADNHWCRNVAQAALTKLIP